MDSVMVPGIHTENLRGTEMGTGMDTENQKEMDIETIGMQIETETDVENIIDPLLVMTLVQIETGEMKNGMDQVLEEIIMTLTTEKNHFKMRNMTLLDKTMMMVIHIIKIGAIHRIESI